MTTRACLPSPDGWGLERNREGLERAERDLYQVERALAVLPDESTISRAQQDMLTLTRQLSHVADVRTRAAERHPPGHLLCNLGTPPNDPRDRALWRQAAHAVENYRLRWNVTGPNRPLGDEPSDPLQQAEHRWVASTLAWYRRELTRDRQLGRTIALGH